MSIHAATLAAALAPGAPAGALDLALTDLHVLGVTRDAEWYEIEFAYTIENVGGVAYDLDGMTPANDSDNAGIQTYLWNNDVGPFFAASGWSISDAPTLAPGDTYSGTFTANTAQLIDPLSFGDNNWLIVDLLIPGEEPERLGNNRRVVLIPAPGPAALAGLGMLVAARRRRS